MHNTVKNLLDIDNNIKVYLNKLNINNNPKIVAVSKTFKIDKILPLIEHGHIDYGENKVQEAVEKWTETKKIKPKVRLHMVGKLQSNKAKKAVELFDYIHSLDSQKLADSLEKYEKSLNKKLKYFIQVNVGMENQKSGIPPNEIDSFYNYCTKEKNLEILGLMAIPPNDGNEDKHFKFLYEASASLGLKDLSMGMSADYKTAIKYKATHLRLGSIIFGDRS